MHTPLLQVKAIRKSYVSNNGWFRNSVIEAVKSVSFELEKGQTLGVVGETGSGKSTLAHLLAGEKEIDSGAILFHGQDLAEVENKQRAMAIRLIPQKPSLSLNPRTRVGEQIIAPLLQYNILDHQQGRQKMLSTLRDIGLLEEHADYYPNMLSSSQRLRVALARALIVDPEVLVFDQTLSAVDITMRAQLLTLLSRLQESRGMAYVVIGHQISMLRHLADHVMVMQHGNVIEQLQADMLFTFDSPKHSYTRRLMQAYQELTQGSVG